MISLNELKSILDTTYDIIKYGESSKKTECIEEINSGILHQHYITYTSRFHDKMKPSYQYYSRDSESNRGDCLISEIVIESYTEEDNIGISYIFIKNDGAYELNLFPKSIDEIQFRVPGYKVLLSEILNDPALLFQISTLHEVPEIEFLLNLSTIVQELKIKMMNYKYKTYCSITKKMPSNNYIHKFHDKMEGKL